MQNKPVVNYHSGSFHVPLGGRAFIMPINHPSKLVSNTELACTSKVLSLRRDATGRVIEFETENTIYKMNGSNI